MGAVDWDDVRRRRLDRSHLAERADVDELVTVARDLCGVHAQVQSSAGLQLAARVDGLTQADVREALWERRALVKAWTVRGTLHLHPAEDLPVWLAARRAVAGDGHGALEAWRDPQDRLHPALSEEEASAARAAVWDALDGRCLLREELIAEVSHRVGVAARERLQSGFAFFLHETCQGPPRGAKVTFARPDQWIEEWFAIDEGEALREVCARFVRTYGPTGPRRFRGWFDAREPSTTALEALFESVGPVDAVFRSRRVGVRLVPEYDAYVMGFREREQLVPERVREQIAGHGRGRFEGAAAVPLVLVDGVAAGIWQRKRRGRGVELTVVLAAAFSRALRKELDDEVERLARFLGLEPSLSVEVVAR
jgi:hypothetical protein